MNGFYFKIDARKQIEQGDEVVVMFAGRATKVKPMVIPAYYCYDGKTDTETIIY